MILLLLACAADLSKNHVWDDGSGVDPFADVPDGVSIVFEDVSDGVLARVDAQDASRWVYFDLDTGEESEDGWDLRFKRFHISGNGGISGSGGVEAVFFGDQMPGDPLVPPEDGWRMDAVDGPDEDEDPDYALSTWYAYDQVTHILTAADGVWLVRSTEGALFGLEVHSYYDDWGTSARVSFTYWASGSGESG